MDQKKYEKLRKKINNKDFEGNNKNFDMWLFAASYLGNIASIFFAYFLIYPSLHKAISINLTSGTLGLILSAGTTILFLTIFEIIKRYLVKNFSFDFVSNRKKIKASIFGWAIALVSIVFLSFYLSLSGSKNLASTSQIVNDSIEVQTTNKNDSIIKKFENKRKIYENARDTLININIVLSQKLKDTPTDNTMSRYQSKTRSDIATNKIDINDYTAKIKEINNELNNYLSESKDNLTETKSVNKSEDSQIIILFIVIAICGEMIIFIGIYFREWYEYNLYLINNQKFEKIRLKKDRYKSVLSYIYEDGKQTTGGKVISGENLKLLIIDKTKIPDAAKFVKEFFGDMDRLGIFVVNGKKRYIELSFTEALNLIETFDDTSQILENIK